jgi:hypothetical protein
MLKLRLLKPIFALVPKPAEKPPQTAPPSAADTLARADEVIE